LEVVRVIGNGTIWYIIYSVINLHNKFEMLVFTNSKDKMEAPKAQRSNDADNLPLTEWFVISIIRLALSVVNLSLRYTLEAYRHPCQGYER